MSNNIDKNSTEQELVAGCINQERQYQELLYQRYADQMYTICLSYAPSEEAACDILQEGFIKVFRKIDQFQATSSLHSWIRKIVVNTALDHYRKQKRQEEKIDSYQQLNINNTTVNNVLDQISVKELIRLVNQLPSKAAMVLKLYAVEGYAHKEIAEKLNITEGTSKSQLHRARTLLKKLLSNQR